MKKLSSVVAVIAVIVVSVFSYMSPIKAGEDNRTPYNGRCLQNITFAPLKAEFSLDLGNRVKCKRSEQGSCTPGKCED